MLKSNFAAATAIPTMPGASVSLAADGPAIRTRCLLAARIEAEQARRAGAPGCMGEPAACATCAVDALGPASTPAA